LIPEEGKIIEKPRTLDGKTMGTFVEDYEKEVKFKGIEHKQNAEWYYDFLYPKVPKLKVVVRGQGNGKGDGKEKQSGEKPDPNETVVEVFDDHSGWDKDNELADELIRAKVEEINKSNKWGNTPAEVIETIMAAQKSSVNWKKFIRRWGGNLAWKEREQTVKRPNRRTGFIHPGHKRIHVDKILLAVDDSGSIGSEALSQFLTEMNRIHDVIPMDVCVFDTEIKDPPKPYSKKRATFDFKGRGGTCFEPVMQLVKDRKYKGVVILTDGCAGAPSRPNARVLWALIDKENMPPVEWGDRVWIKKH
jgi:predicted metal-dependent peptidase